ARPAPDPLWPTLKGAGRPPADARVSVLIPTVDRYPWLRVLLGQLAEQTVPPVEVIVVDQTPEQRREADLAAEFPALPLRVLVRREAGQCSSRNAGLDTATGSHILFLDDDVEIEPTLIEDHLRSLDATGADVSSGVVEEMGAGPLAASFHRIRVSNVFPTNNTLIRAPVLAASGLFDLAYDRGQRADGDLGRRIYRTGALMVLNPEISVLHHRAPRGGLRVHGARVDTYAASRRALAARNLPTVSDLYLARRYGTPRQAREARVLGVLGTFAIRGGPLRKALKAAVGVARLPDTLVRIHRRSRAAERLLERYPEIPPGDRFAPGAGRP
ncbi:MAG TPA: glycosyltransferase family A protein, partial [Gemmatimonadota bacterium]|nr:glycosyltransferase family A protein [Gemmatimonadota bacterium]